MKNGNQRQQAFEENAQNGCVQETLITIAPGIKLKKHSQYFTVKSKTRTPNTLTITTNFVNLRTMKLITNQTFFGFFFFNL